MGSVTGETRPLYVRIDHDVHTRLHVEADRHEMSLSRFCNRLLREAMDTLPDEPNTRLTRKIDDVQSDDN